MATIFTPTQPANGPWQIDREDCIGDSLQYINANTNYLAAQIINSNNFLNTQLNTLSSTVLPSLPPRNITFINPNTEVNLVIDTSSLGQTINRLTEMFQRYLPTILLPFYNNNTFLYDQRVRLINYGGERTFSSLGVGRVGTNNGVGNVVNIMFQDEADTGYHNIANTFSPTNPRTSTYNTDITTMRTIINSYPNNYFRFLVFSVKVANDLYRKNFTDFLFSVLNGVGNYGGEFGLADKKQLCRFSYDVSHDAAPAYYAEILRKELITL
jgi:hypothetical protein